LPFITILLLYDQNRYNRRMSEEKAIDQLCNLIQILRGKSGCPWDKEQTFDDVLPSIIEEAYELEWANAKRSREDVLDELGDVLFLICFAVMILHEEDKTISIESIASRAYQKIKRRHPHVFGQEKALTKEESLVHWNRMKEKEKQNLDHDESALSSIPENLTPIKRAEILQRCAAKVGFDWPDTTGIIEKLREELEEADSCIPEGSKEEKVDEIGDLLFSVVNLSRFLDISAESSIERANAKFSNRFRKMEALIRENGKAMQDMTLDEMDVYWEKVKASEP
jgi:MazG family protein